MKPTHEAGMRGLWLVAVVMMMVCALPAASTGQLEFRIDAPQRVMYGDELIPLKVGLKPLKPELFSQLPKPTYFLINLDIYGDLNGTRLQLGTDCRLKEGESIDVQISHPEGTQLPSLWYWLEADMVTGLGTGWARHNRIVDITMAGHASRVRISALEPDPTDPYKYTFRIYAWPEDDLVICGDG